MTTLQNIFEIIDAAGDGGEEPRPRGPEDEPAGEDAGQEKSPASTRRKRPDAPAPLPAQPLGPSPEAPDANPVDPRVF